MHIYIYFFYHLGSLAHRTQVSVQTRHVLVKEE